MAYNKDLLKNYLEKKGEEQWDAFTRKGAQGALQFELLLHFIEKYFPPEDCLILDVGIEPGNFAIKLAQKNRRIVLADLSESQLQITREKIDRYKVSSQVEQFVLLDELIDFSTFNDNTFDMVLCLSGTLSFACDERVKMFQELVRVTKNGAPLIISVKCKAQYFREIIREGKLQKLLEPTKAGLWEIIDTNYKPFEDYPEEPAYYAFTGKELKEVIEENGCEVLEIAAINSVSTNLNRSLQEIRENEEAWNTVVRIEKELCVNPNLWDTGEEILAVARKTII